MKQWFAIVLIAFAMAGNVAAKAYKCEQDGKTVFTDTPCSIEQGPEVKPKPNNAPDYTPIVNAARDGLSTTYRTLGANALSVNAANAEAITKAASIELTRALIFMAAASALIAIIGLWIAYMIIKAAVRNGIKESRLIDAVGRLAPVDRTNLPSWKKTD